MVLLVVGVVAPNLAFGFVVARLRWCGLALVIVPVGLVVVHTGSEAFLTFLSVSVLTAVDALVIGLGVALALAIERVDGSWKSTTHAAAGLVLVGSAPLCLLIPIVGHNQTVRISGPRTVSIDPKRGSYDGVGVGDDIARLQARFGAGQPERNSRSGPTDATGEDGPAALPGDDPRRGDRFARYRGVSFHLARGRRVDYLEITSRQAKIPEGIGAGDSIALVKHAYPALRCAEDSLGGEGSSTPYPYCTGRLGSRAFIYIGGTYKKAGTPITSMWLSAAPLQ